MSQESLKIVTLNCGRGNKHLQETVAFLNGCDADIACLQDIRKEHIPELTQKFGYAGHFAPMTNHLVAGGGRSLVGIGIFSRSHEFISINTRAYLGRVSPVADLQGIEVDAEGNSMNHDLELVRATESRLAIFVEVDFAGKLLILGTTHGTWVKGGQPDNDQRISMGILASVMARLREGRGFVMAGDFNFSRGGEIYKSFVPEARVLDMMLERIVTTLDPVNHPLKGKVNVVSDYVFSSGMVQVENVEAHFGVSDHAALTATITRY